MPDEEQRVQVATLLLFALFAGVKPAELVDSLSAKEKNIQDAFWRKAGLWDDPKTSGYDDIETDPLEQCKSLCWEDVELRKMALADGRTKFAMWIRFAYHKGLDRKPLPCVYCHLSIASLLTSSSAPSSLRRGGAPNLGPHCSLGQTCSV